MIFELLLANKSYNSKLKQLSAALLLFWNLLHSSWLQLKLILLLHDFSYNLALRCIFFLLFRMNSSQLQREFSKSSLHSFSSLSTHLSMINPFAAAKLKHLAIIEAILNLIHFVPCNGEHNIGLRIFLSLHLSKSTYPAQNYVISLNEASEVKSYTIIMPCAPL